MQADTAKAARLSADSGAAKTCQKKHTYKRFRLLKMLCPDSGVMLAS